MTKRIIIGVNSSWNLFNFRAGLVRALLEAGHEVIVAAPADTYSARIPELGCRFIPLDMDVKGKNPINDLLLTWRFLRIFRRTKPDIFLGFTIKPNIFGSLAARLAGVAVINNITGLGVGMARKSLLSGLIEFLYRRALKLSRKVFFQNEEDMHRFVSTGLVASNIVERLPGSGVDLTKFRPTPLPGSGRKELLRFLLMGRMLWSKGVGEYVEAARIVRAGGGSARFCLLGFIDVENPEAVARSVVEDWQREGLIDYLGTSDDVKSELERTDCMVLPSYYPEGVPRSLLEAAASGRPIITTNMAGCRDTVEDGVNGFLCRPRDAQDLARQIEKIMALDAKALEDMGSSSRDLAERRFDEKIVIDRYLSAIAAA